MHPLICLDGRRRRYEWGRTVSVPRHRLWTPAQDPQYEHLFDLAGSDTPGKSPPPTREGGWGPATSGEAARGSGVGAPRQAAKPPAGAGLGPRDKRRSRPASSVAVGDRYLEVLADCSPDVLRRLTLGERLMDGSVAEPADHLVAGHRVGVGRAEPRLHPLPELGQPHASPG